MFKLTLLTYFCAYFVLLSLFFNYLITAALRRYLISFISGLFRRRIVTFYYYYFVYNKSLTFALV